MISKKLLFAALAPIAAGFLAQGCIRPVNPVTPNFPTFTPAFTSTGTPSPSPTAPATLTATSSPTASSTPSATSAPSLTPTATPSPSPTAPAAFTATSTATASGTPTKTPASTATQTGTSTPGLTSTATVSASLTATAVPSGTPSGLDVSGFVSMGAGTYSYTYLHLHSGGELAVSGPVTFALSGYFSLDAGSTLTGEYSSGLESAGTGPNDGSSAAGAGHGGAGGSDQLGNAGGPAYDNPTAPALAGSYGDRNCSVNVYALGGGLISIQVPSGPATLDGFILCAGQVSTFCNGGGNTPTGAGSGGAVFLQADTLVGNGLIQAAGGQGLADTAGVDNAGGGGGGIVVLSTHTANNFTGTASVQGGTAVSPAQPGQAGAYNTATY